MSHNDEVCDLMANDGRSRDGGWKPIITAPRDGTVVWILLERVLNDRWRHKRVAMWSTLDLAWFCPYNRVRVDNNPCVAVAWHPYTAPPMPPAAFEFPPVTG